MNLRAKLSIAGEPVGRGGGVSSWNDIENKPFSTVDTENGLTIQDDTLMIDTLDHIATIDYVDEQIAGISTTVDWDDIEDKPTFATVATSGDYDDLSNKPTIPSIDGLATETYVNDAIAAIDIPTDVSELNNDAGYITNSALSGYATETYVDNAVDGITTTLETDYATKAELPVATSDLTNDSGFITASALTPYAESADLATVATSGSYNDLSNKPTIPTVPTNVSDFTNDAGYITSADLPEADGTTIIDNNGVWSAVGAGVDIDNQSIVENQQGQIETAVKLYKEDVTTTYNAIKGWTSDDSRYIYAKNNDYARYLRGALTNLSNAYYTVIVNFDYNNQNYQLSGVCNSIGSLSSSNFLNGDIMDHFYGFGVQNAEYSARLYCQYRAGSNYTINWVVIKEAEYNATYSDTDQDVVESVYHKLPINYIPIDGVIKRDSNGNISLAHDFIYDMISVGNGFTKSKSSSSTYPNYSGISLEFQTNSTVNKTSTSNGFRTAVGGAFGSADGNSFSQTGINFTRRSGANNILEANANVFNNFGENNYCWVRMYYNYAGLNNPTGANSCPYTIAGRLHLGSILTDPSDFTIEGLESILDSAVYDSSISKYVFTFKSDIYPANQYSMDVYYLSNAQFRPLNDKYQKINSFFLPLDNNTIKRDSDGNITTAIPAPPTTDGNYTLAVTVTNGEPTYSWV